MGTHCCTLRDKSDKDDPFDLLQMQCLEQNSHQSQQLNEVQRSLFFIGKYFENSKSISHCFKFNSDRDDSVLTLIYAKDQLRNYVMSLPQIMATIKTKGAGKTFIPIAIQNIKIGDDVNLLVVMRQIEKVDRSFLGQEVIDEIRLSKSFILKTFQFSDSDNEARKQLLVDDLKNLYMNEGLIFIGGVQDEGKVNNAQLLFFRTEILRTSGSLRTNYDLQVELKSAEASTPDLSEAFLNELILEKEMSLRSVLTFEDTYSRNQFFVLQKTSKTEQMFTVNSFSSSIIAECEQIYQSQQKCLLIEKLSKYLNTLENKNKNHLLEVITGQTLGETQLVFSQ